MSHQAVTWAMKKAPMLLTVKGKPDTTARHVLAVLAECAEADGSEARPSLMTIQHRTGYDRRTVQRALRRLEEGGLIKAGGVKFGCTVYQLAMHLTRPESDWAELEAEEARQKDADAERQRRSRARRVTHAESVTVTDAECVTGPDVTDADDVSHALSVPTSRTQNPDVTDGTPPNTSFERSGDSSSLSSLVPQQAGESPSAASDEREIDPLIQKLMNDHGATEDEAATILDQVRREGRIGSLAGWATSITGQLDIKQRLYALRMPQRLGPAGPSLPPWCGECNDGDPAAATDPARRFHHLDDGSSRRCDCHPASQKAA